MPTFLSDPPLLGLFTLGIMALIAGGLWVRYRLLPLLIAAVLLVVLIIVWMVLGMMSESPREESVRRVSELAAAVTEKSWAKFSENVSEAYSDTKNRKKADLKSLFDQAAQYGARAAVWNIELTDPPVLTDTEVKLRFDGKAEAQGREMLLHFQATFVKDPDGKFRLKSYAPFNYVQKNQPESFP